MRAGCRCVRRSPSPTDPTANGRSEQAAAASARCSCHRPTVCTQPLDKWRQTPQMRMSPAELYSSHGVRQRDCPLRALQRPMRALQRPMYPGVRRPSSSRRARPRATTTSIHRTSHKRHGAMAAYRRADPLSDVVKLSRAAASLVLGEPHVAGSRWPLRCWPGIELKRIVILVGRRNEHVASFYRFWYVRLRGRLGVVLVLVGSPVGVRRPMGPRPA